MTAVEYPSHDFYARHDVPYTSLPPSATAPVCSDAPSKFQGFYEPITSTLNDFSKCHEFPDGANLRWKQGLCKSVAQPAGSEAPRPLRQNPRRTSNTATTRTGCPPPLVRQAERKLNFVDNLVDSSTQIVMAIWPNSSPLCPEAARDSSVLPLRTFIQETLRRSRTSYSTLQVALYYLVLIKDKLPARDFTMEQTDDCHSSRALQCGRRMFLAALILASKYLQDRNYSARAWSKISGLNTNEINQNEMAFVLAVNWKLHISEQVYHRWTDCVMKHSPSQPPAPPTLGSLTSKMEYDVQLNFFSKQCAYFQEIIRLLNPDLENLEDALVRSNCSPVPSLSPRSLSPRSVLAAAQDVPKGFLFGSSDFGSRDATPTPCILRTPSTMEPYPSSVQSATRIAPAFGLLPTPRLTPQVSALRDLSPPHTAGSAMSMAVSAAGSVQSGMILDKWPSAITSSPVHYHTSRRASLATSVSTVSSPESMVSDLSGSSRSSSISSVSSLGGAPYVKADHVNLEVQARCRSAKQLMNEKYATRPVSVAEDYIDRITSSPMSFTGSLNQEHLSYTAQMARDLEIDDATNDAAQALQALHNSWQLSRAARKSATSAPKAGSKRSRPMSIDVGLHENVRGLLRSEYIIETPTASPHNDAQVVALSCEGRKRICCSAEAARCQSPATGFEGPGMWAGILN